MGNNYVGKGNSNWKTNWKSNLWSSEWKPMQQEKEKQGWTKRLMISSFQTYENE